MSEGVGLRQEVEEVLNAETRQGKWRDGGKEMNENNILVATETILYQHQNDFIGSHYTVVQNSLMSQHLSCTFPRAR